MLYEEQEFISGCKLCAKIRESQMHIMLSKDDVSKGTHAEDLYDKIVEYRKTIPEITRDKINLDENGLEKWAKKIL